MILIWGVSNDGPVQAAGEALTRAGVNWRLLDQLSVARYEMSFTGPDGADGWLRLGEERLELGSIISFYPRPYESRRVLQAADLTAPELAEQAARFDDAMLTWLELTEALVVNRPSAMTSNGSKPLQSALIAGAGFAVPEILLTTDAAAAAAFRQSHGRVIYKSIGGVRSRVSLLDDTALARLDGAACALQLQEYIDGTDFRVHVLGEDVFACRIESGAMDYRYPAAGREETRITACDLPGPILRKCVELTYQLGLAFAGIDLRYSTDGRWVCFEANPSPGYTFYERATGAPITAALAALLQRGKCQQG